MSKNTNIDNLIINKMTYNQFKDLQESGQIEDTQLYTVTDKSGKKISLQNTSVTCYLPELATFNFKIDDTTYTADKNMTWGEWVASNYNTDGYWIGKDTEGLYSVIINNYEVISGRSTKSEVENILIVANATYHKSLMAASPGSMYSPEDHIISIDNILTNNNSDGGGLTGEDILNLTMSFGDANGGNDAIQDYMDSTLYNYYDTMFQDLLNYYGGTYTDFFEDYNIDTAEWEFNVDELNPSEIFFITDNNGNTSTSNFELNELSNDDIRDIDITVRTVTPYTEGDGLAIIYVSEEDGIIESTYGEVMPSGDVSFNMSDLGLLGMYIVCTINS